MLWFMNLIAHHLNEDENWLETADDLKDWQALPQCRALGGPSSCLGALEGEGE